LVLPSSVCLYRRSSAFICGAFDLFLSFFADSLTKSQKIHYT
jgi:hypothetical protein